MFGEEDRARLVQPRRLGTAGCHPVRNNMSFALLEFWYVSTQDRRVLDRSLTGASLVSRALGLNPN